MFDNLTKTSNKSRLANLGLMLALSVTSAGAFADVPTAATTALTSVQTDGLAMIDAGWPVLGAIVTAFVLMKLFKRVVSKAS